MLLQEVDQTQDWLSSDDSLRFVVNCSDHKIIEGEGIDKPPVAHIEDANRPVCLL